jgi:acetyl/propionyl-CoA carboxylase alpha subunit
MPQNSPQKHKVLVLGHTVETQRLCAEIEAEGFESCRVREPLPSVLDPEAVRHFRAILSKYAGADYLHPGLTDWADRPELATIAQQEGLVLIGPSSRVLTLFGNRLSFIQEAESAGIPNLVIPPAEPIHSLREIEVLIQSERLKFPFVLKSALGRPAVGVIVIQDSSDLESKLPLWVEQLRRNSGEVILFCERYLEGAHLVSVPFARLLDGRAVTFPLVDGSLECRYRKIVEFCPADLTATIEKLLRKWSLELAQRIGCVGVGAMEFLVDGDRAYLIGGAARLDASFPIWEQVAGTRAFAWQIAALQTGTMQKGARQQGATQGGAQSALPSVESHGLAKKAALGITLYAEDPILQLPQPGMVRELSEARIWPKLSDEVSAELALTLEPGHEVDPVNHGVIGAIWVTARNRAQTLLIARGVLDELWIAGSLQTNERFISELLVHPWVREGMFHAGFIDEEFLPALRPPADDLPLFASVVRSVVASDRANAEASAPLENVPAGERWSVGGQWVRPEKTETMSKWMEGPFVWRRDERIGVSGKILAPDGRTLRVCAFPLGDSKWQVRIGQWVMITRRISSRSSLKTKKSPRLYSLIPGRVHAVLYRSGAIVPAHEPLLIVESLGTLIAHAVPSEVRIQNWKIVAEDQVVAGQELAELEIVQPT